MIEAIKYEATWMNTLSVSLLTVGFLAPIATYLSGITKGAWSPEASIVMLTYAVTGAAIHAAAIHKVGSLK